MKTGDKVIYFKSYSFEPPPARIGSVNRVFTDSITIDSGDGGLVTTTARHVHPYTEALWSAWQQWQQNAKLLDQQHKQLMAGKAPDALLHLNLFDKF